MAQDYNIQLDGLNKLKTTVMTLIESLNNYRSAYGAVIDSSRENGLSVQMHERLAAQNLPRTSDHVKAFIESIEQIDVPWINRLIDGFGAACEAAGCAGASAGASSASVSAADKAGRFRDASRRIVERTAVKLKKDADGEPENERDIHADFLAAYLNSRKSR